MWNNSLPLSIAFIVSNPLLVVFSCPGLPSSRDANLPSFDEVHFGGFASKYIRRRFFMDVHPPLAKLLITLSAWIGGFDGVFDFKDIGKCVRIHSSCVAGIAAVPLPSISLAARLGVGDGDR
jgi:hypothetical protein